MILRDYSSRPFELATRSGLERLRSSQYMLTIACQDPMASSSIPPEEQSHIVEIFEHTEPNQISQPTLSRRQRIRSRSCFSVKEPTSSGAILEQNMRSSRNRIT